MLLKVDKNEVAYEWPWHGVMLSCCLYSLGVLRPWLSVTEISHSCQPTSEIYFQVIFESLLTMMIICLFECSVTSALRGKSFTSHPVLCVN